MNVTVPIYEARADGDLDWITLGLGPHTIRKSGRSPMKIQQSIADRLKRDIGKLHPVETEILQMSRGMRLERARLSLSLRADGRRRKITGLFPIVVEPRWANAEDQILVAYHPHRQEEWFPLDPDQPLDEQAARYLQRAWAALEDHEIEDLKAPPKDQLRTLAFTAHPRSLLDKLPKEQASLWDDLKADPIQKKDKRSSKKGLKVLPRLALNLSLRAADGLLPLGAPREPCRQQLQQALCGPRKRSTLVVGPPGCGKTIALNRLVADMLDADDWRTHRNLDRAWAVWRLSGSRIIAGMKYLGDWEQRCVEILDDTRARKVILWIEDLAAFGQLGRTRDSDRSLAAFFRGPISRGELILIGECTPAQLQRLEDDAPSFAALLTRVNLPETTQAETLRMMIGEARLLEARHKVIFNPLCLRAALEMTDTLLTGQAFPGKALDALRRLAREAEAHQKGQRPDPETWTDPKIGIGPEAVIELLSARTGLPASLLAPSEALDPQSLRARFEARVMGQPQGVEAVTDLILRIRAGLTDPRRPYGVFLFTGPTGVGKTELARALAAELYSDPRRLIRLDMSEFNHPGAAARLVGDRFDPEGLLTRQVRDQPFCVVLLDEIEKAHGRALGLLLQLFDEGRLTDAAGNTADFTHAVIVMTSNLGARAREPVGFGQSAEAVMHDVARAVEGFFSPELFNRIDQIVPFRPLSRPAAAQVAARELGRLLTRRGLTERRIFVERASDAVIDKIVADGFVPGEGARSLKRTLDAEIGTLLADHVTGRRLAAMEVLRLYVRDGAFMIHAEPLTEADALDVEWALEPLLDAPLPDLQALLPEAAGFLRQIVDSEDLARLSALVREHLRLHNLGREGHADKIYDLDAMRTQVRDFSAMIDAMIEAQGEADDPEMLEVLHFSRLERGVDYRNRARNVRLFDPRMMFQLSERLEREPLLAALAEVRFLKRALSLVHDPSQHAVFIDLLRVGHGAGDDHDPEAMDLMGGLLEGYAGWRGELEGCAGWRSDRGHLEHGAKDWKALIAARPDRAVLKIVGLCVREAFEGESGTHILQTLSMGPQVLRVQVRSAEADLRCADEIEARIVGGARFQAAIERGDDPLPENPAGLLAAVRRLKQEPTRRGSGESLIEIEDYALAQTPTLRVRRLADALERLWLTRLGGPATP